jgi:DNA-binding transcriptional LysR family regulator
LESPGSDQSRDGLWLFLVVTGKDAYDGRCRILAQEPLTWVVGKDTEVSLYEEAVNLVLLPSPCSFRKIATEGLEKANRNWEIVFTGTSLANIQAAVQAGMGLSILPVGAIKEGLRKAPIHLGLPELPMHSIVLITNASKGMTQCT